MKVKCKQCGYELNSDHTMRCPRCNNVVGKKQGCENCKGCSLFKSCGGKE